MKNEIKNIIDHFKNLKILVIGDAILDTYIYGTTDRICREAPVPVFNSTEENYSCGGAANTAINVSALGAETYYLTVLGKDFNAKCLLDNLHRNNVHTEFILKDKTRKTIAKKRVIASSNIILRLDEGTTADINDEIENELLQKFFEIEDFVDAIIISDYGFGVITDSFIHSLQSIGSFSKPIIVDSKDVSRFKNLHPFAVKPNYEEVLQLLKIPKVPKNKRIEQILKKSDALLKNSGAENVVVTLDIDGVILFQKAKKAYHVNCVPRDLKNTIGAGDTFISALTLAAGSGLKMEEATEIAAAAAAIVVQKDGTALCTNVQLKSYFNSVPKYISNTEELESIIKELRKKGKKIVFTNGCFDLIHKGHIALLNKAREAGDVLIVGVNNDESARKVKGPDRPVNTLEDRITVLAGLQSIDYIISFGEESPLQLIKSVHPDVFVKGADYTEKSIPELPLLKKLSCQVKIIPCLQDISTTNIIHRINEIVEETEQKNEVKKTGKIMAEEKSLS
ncbi:MAG TPA: D-glycero-beta-D-manno-heptose 1-phosphate adenylyltransferase [Hanamia sp.]|nr:D-glycero-beta-D-manno-heptose 1-phosphate adenylyltransferase [Hanamia sp.]